MRIVTGLLLTLFVALLALAVGNLITWHAETGMEWDALHAAAAGHQGALLVMIVGFGLLAVARK